MARGDGRRVVTEDVECALCHKPIRSATARERRIGSRCWRKLTPAQRAALRRNPRDIRAVLSRPVPNSDGQLPLEEEDPAAGARQDGARS